MVRWSTRSAHCEKKKKVYIHISCGLPQKHVSEASDLKSEKGILQGSCLDSGVRRLLSKADVTKIYVPIEAEH